MFQYDHILKTVLHSQAGTDIIYDLTCILGSYGFL